MGWDEPSDTRGTEVVKHDRLYTAVRKMVMTSKTKYVSSPFIHRRLFDCHLLLHIPMFPYQVDQIAAVYAP